MRRTNYNHLLEEVTVIMPVAGRAVRARAVTNDTIPKHLLPLGNGQPVLSMICRELQRLGFRRFVFCVGFLKDQIIEHVANRSWISREGVSYEFSELDAQRGPDGAVLGAIRSLGLQGNAMMIPGDMMLPWDGIAEMNLAQIQRGSGVTVSVTSYITERTTDVGKFMVEPNTGRLLRVYARDEAVPIVPGAARRTCAGAMAISINSFVELCNAYLRAQTDDVQCIGLRDQVLPWALEKGGFELYSHDVRGEVLDLGIPPNIRYGQENWRQYVSEEVARMK